MPTFKITLAYDGTDLVGWQRQAAGVSVQGLLEDALEDLDGRAVTVIGAGRTDAGVHALGQVASFTLDRVLPAGTMVRALNARLPASVRVIAAAEASSTFHARYAARTKTYRYRMWQGDVMPPFERAYSWHLTGALDLDRMAEAARLIEGRHDFSAFEAAGGAARQTAREVLSSRIAVHPCEAWDPGPRDDLGPSGRLIAYEVSGTGFLRHMVRTIVGTLVEIGRGRQPPRWIEEVLRSRDRTQAGPTAPAQGLFLVRVAYDAGAVAAES
jgi:tRNA pseudouridine38-40 synthase